MKIDRGIFFDCSEVDQPPGTYRFAKNIVDTNLLGVKENEDGFTNLSTMTPYTFIGSVPVDDDNVVVFSTNNTDSEIGLVNLSVPSYTQIYNDPELNLNTGFPIQGEYRKDVNGDRIVTWTDVRNTLRIINIDDLSGIDDVQDLNAFQDVNNPSLSSYSISNSGGSLKTGSYIPITKYKNRDGSETNWFVHDHTFYINDDSTTESFNENDGAEPGTVTNKAINFTLDDCDTRFDTIVVGYIQVINNVITAYEAIERSNSTTITIAITGSESTTDVTLDDVLTPTANYDTVGTVTQLAGQLYAANLTTSPLPELQPYALSIRIDYTHSLMNVISNTNSQKDSIPPAFMPGEVYALYLGVELNKGGWVFYHIPGRPATVSPYIDTSAVSANGMNYLRYQVEDTSDKSGALTNMGYWHNVNEVYPNDSAYDGTSVGGSDLRNTNVRHHRFPTLQHLVDTHYSGDTTVGITNLIRLGVSVSNVNIPAGIQSQIKRWKIFFAKKEINNSLVIGSDLWHPSVPTQADSTIRWSSGGNWITEARRDGGDWQDFATPTDDTIRGHCLDFAYSNTPITPTYALFNYALKRRNLNEQYNGFRSSGARVTISGQDRGGTASAVIDFTVPDWTARSGSGFIKRLDNFTFLPQNSLNGKFKSQDSEGVFTADVNSPGTDFDALIPIRLLTRASNTGSEANQFREVSTDTVTTDIGEMTMYLQYYRLLSDVHTSFLQQDLIPVENYGLPGDTVGTFNGGDSFMCYMSYLATAPLRSNPDASDDELGLGVKVWKAYIGYSRFNFNFRYQTQGDLSTYYHGKTDVRTLFTPTVVDANQTYVSLILSTQSLNVINYDSTMNTSNIYQVGSIFNPSIPEATEFPDTIIWSPVQNEESKEFSWRSFPAGNRYVIPKNKGDIINIQGFRNDQLLINTEDSFFRTRSDVKMTTETGEVYLKTASIFDIPPDEVVPSKTGCAGTQHKFACVLTKSGYVFPDDRRGAVFLYDGNTLDEISSNGSRIFFRDFMGVTQDNPFTQTGYTTGYDPTVNRIILTKKNGATSWTYSYNPIRKTWISWHDYIPDYMFNTLSGKLYSSKSSVFHLNKGGAKGTYYGVTYPSYIDVTFNQESDKIKLPYAINWSTEVYPNTYVDGQPSSVLDYNTTCTHLTVKSPDHCTGRVTLSRTTSIYDFNEANIRNQDRVWIFNDIRDFATTQGGFIQGFYLNYGVDATKLNMNMEWYEQRRFIDKFVSCRFEYDNVQNKRWLFQDANAEFKLIP